MAFTRINWVALSPEQARGHPFYGFGGWNWLLLLWLLVFLGANLAALATSPFAWVLSLFYLALCGMLIFRARLFRFVFFAHVGLIFVTSLISQFRLFANIQGVPAGAAMPPLLLAAVGFAIYVNESRRINVTQCHRVRHDDPFLEQLPS